MVGDCGSISVSATIFGLPTIDSVSRRLIRSAFGTLHIQREHDRFGSTPLVRANDTLVRLCLGADARARRRIAAGSLCRGA